LLPGYGPVLRKRSRASFFCGLGEAGFLLALGAVVFWLYYRMYILGPEHLLPSEWRNPGR
jgi:hypothetical protein